MRKTTFTIALLFFAVSCKSDKIEPAKIDCPDEISFSQTVGPMVTTNCGGCHGTGGTSPVLTNHSEISANANSILSRIQLAPTSSQLMPLGGPKLADSTIQQFKCWMDQGKLDN